MPSVSLLFQTSKPRAKLGGIVLDACVREEHVTRVSATVHPIESGSHVTDHIRVEPDTVTIEGVISDTPLHSSVQSVFYELSHSAESIRLNQEFGPAAKASRAVSAYRALVALQRARLPIRLVTGLRVYSNMVIVSLSVPRNMNTGKAVRFTATLRRVQILTTAARRINRETVSESQRDVAQSRVDVGRQALKAAEAAAAKEARRIIKGLL